MTVTITDWTFPNLDVERAILETHGIRLVAEPSASESALIDRCADADVVITQFAKINAAVIGGMRKARAIVRYGIGVDNVDLEAAAAKQIPVCNVPDYCIDEVADQTLSFILALTRQVVSHATHLRNGKWGLIPPLSNMKALRDLTVGVVGCGRIGREVIRRLIPFKSRILVFDPQVEASEMRALGATPVSLDELLSQVDIVTLHCPSTPRTRRMINAESLARVKPGALLVNVSRGDLVDPEALTLALQSGKLAGAALDVFDPEPIPAGHPILQMSNVVLAPHVASCSMPAVTKLRESVANLALAAIQGQPLKSVVNGVRK